MGQVGKIEQHSAKQPLDKEVSSLERWVKLARQSLGNQGEESGLSWGITRRHGRDGERLRRVLLA